MLDTGFLKESIQLVSLQWQDWEPTPASETGNFIQSQKGIGTIGQGDVINENVNPDSHESTMATIRMEFSTNV